MLSIRPIIGAVACGALLWAGLGLSNLHCLQRFDSPKPAHSNALQATAPMIGRIDNIDTSSNHPFHKST